VGHFDNYTCWLHGDESGTEKEGLKTMLEEVEFLTGPEIIQQGQLEVSIFGGAMLLPNDDYAKNAMSLLRALTSSDRALHLTHLCVGPYNTQLDQDGKAKSILSGVAVDLGSGRIFPASFEWNNFEDMTNQIKNIVLRFLLHFHNHPPQHTDVIFGRRGGGEKKGVGEEKITKLSTFKPKPFRNHKQTHTRESTLKISPRTKRK